MATFLTYEQGHWGTLTVPDAEYEFDINEPGGDFVYKDAEYHFLWVFGSEYTFEVKVHRNYEGNNTLGYRYFLTVGDSNGYEYILASVLGDVLALVKASIPLIEISTLIDE